MKITKPSWKPSIRYFRKCEPIKHKKINENEARINNKGLQRHALGNTI